MTFKSSILAGMTLIREAIQSQGFQAGVTGWAIRADGTAEFSDLTIRSSDGSGSTVVVANGVITILDGLGHTVVRIDSQGYTLYNSTGAVVAQIVLDAGQTLGGFYCRNFAAPENVYAFLSGGQLTSGPVTNSVAAIHGFLQYVIAPAGIYSVQTLSSGAIDFALDDEARIQLISERGQRSVCWVDGGSGAVAANLHATGSVLVDEDVVIGGVTQGRGRTAFKAIIANTGTVTTTETIAITTPSATFVSGRAYEVEIKGLAQSSVALDGVQLKVHKTNAAGQILMDTMAGITIPTANSNYLYTYKALFKVTGANVTAAMVMTFVRRVGTGNVRIAADATSPSWVVINDIGLASDYVDINVLV